MTDSTAGQLISLGVLAGITALLVIIRRRVAVATVSFMYTTADNVQHNVAAGDVIPRADLPLAPAGSYSIKFLPLFRSLIVGADNRTSTSKTVALAWTYAIAYGLIALIVAKWLGTDKGYAALVKNGIQEEYWLFLGGTFAAAVLAKWSAIQADSGSGKTAAPVGDANAKQLVANDAGDGDLGDFQYVLFNAIALAVYLGEFVSDSDGGLPTLPKVLTGLALTSAGAYSAKKLFLNQTPPTLTAVHPPEITGVGASQTPVSVDLWGTNLIVPADVAPGGTALAPKVAIGGTPATVTTSEPTFGADHLTVEVPTDLQPGVTKITAVRADGIAAIGPGGSNGIALTIRDPMP
jgi:hypothetical protein